MSKGQRTKNTGVENESSANYQKTYEGKAREKSDKMKKIALIVSTIAVALFLIGMTAYNAIHDSGIIERNTVAVSSENFEIDNAVASYYFREQYSAFMTQYSSMISYLGLDTSAPLKSQSCTMGGEGINTWYDFFLNQTKEYINQLLVLCEGAKEAGISLGDEEKDAINEAIDGIEDAAKEAGYGKSQYLKLRFGNKIKEGDIKKALELTMLASKYTTALYDEADVGEDALEAKYAENASAYEKVSYRSVTFDYKDLMPEDEDAEKGAETGDDAEKPEDEAAKAEAVTRIAAYADELLACATEEDYVAYVKDHMVNVLGVDAENAEDAMKNTLQENISFSESNEKIKWAFEAKVGDKKSFPENDGEKITVMYLVKEPARDEEHARDVRHILFKTDTYGDDTETKAREVYDKWVEDGASMDNFDALVKEYSEDTGSVANGGLYEDVREGDMDSGFNDWLFDSARVAGDHGLAKTTYGWHIMYYVGEGETAWKLDAIKNIQEEHYSEVVEKLTSEKEIAINEDKLNVADIDE